MKAALIGLGMVSGTYADAVRNTKDIGCTLVHARSSQARDKFLADWPDLNAKPAETVTDIAQSEVDFVILATPPNARAEIVAELAAAGKPILMEKPVERTLDAATALVELCEGQDIPLGIMLQHRARPVVADLHGLLPKLGTLMAVEISVPWWRPQAYYNEPGRGSYARDGGGVLISQAIHTLDLALTLTGRVAEVTAMTATTGLHQMESEDFVSAGLRFANGAVGQIFATTASFPGDGETITLHFANGSARLEAGQLAVTWQNGEAERFGQAATSGGGADPMAFTSDWHRFVIEDFADAIQTKRDPIASGRSALEVHRLIAALERSGREGRKITLEDL